MSMAVIVIGVICAVIECCLVTYFIDQYVTHKRRYDLFFAVISSINLIAASNLVATIP